MQDANVAQERLANELQQQPPDDLEDGDAEDALDIENDNIVLSPHMMLTPVEHAFALQLKESIENNCPQLDNLSDFMYGTLAIVAEGDMDRALEIATRMQDFRTEYDILHTLEDGLRHKEAMYVKQTDGNRGVLEIQEDTDDGTIFIIHDLPKVDLRNYKSPQQIQRFFKGLYYLNMAVKPDFRALRVGVTHLIECEGYKWKHNMMDVDFMKRIFCNAGATFPIKKEKHMFFNSPMVANIMVSSAKSLLPKHMADDIHMGCRAPHRLDQLYNVPTMEVAEQRLEANVEALLRRRCRNETTYRLCQQQALEANGT